MTLSLLIAGGRETRIGPTGTEMLDALADELKAKDDIEIIVGDARGVDADALQWAMHRGFLSRLFKADWATRGKAAGPKRNELMVQRLCDHGGAAALFPGGRGTEWTHRYLIEYGFMPVATEAKEDALGAVPTIYWPGSQRS